MRVTRDTGIIVVCGELIKSKFYLDKDGYMRAIYYIKTSGTNWTDPTGASGAKDINWTVSAWDSAASLADPDFPFPKKYIAIEGIPTTETTVAPRLLPHASVACGEEFWRTRTNRPKKAIKLRALFSMFIDDYEAKQLDLANHVKWHPPGTKYSPWWREDIVPDNAPYLLPETLHLTGEQDWGLGFQDDMRSDMEFFYEDERWSRDP